MSKNLSLYDVPVTTTTGRDIMVRVLAISEDAATIIAMTNYGPSPEAQDAAELLDSADFQDFWPAGVAEALVRASETEGPLPAYGLKQFHWASAQALRVERKMTRDLERGQEILRNLPANERNLVRS